MITVCVMLQYMYIMFVCLNVCFCFGLCDSAQPLQILFKNCFIRCIRLLECTLITVKEKAETQVFSTFKQTSQVVIFIKARKMSV